VSCANQARPLHEASRHASSKTVVGNPDPAVQKGNGGYADWVIISIHSLHKYLDHPYRIFLDVLHECPIYRIFSG